MPPKLSVNRRAHFPVGGKRNTMNFFGHGNRPKKKGKTAAEEEDDERPRRRKSKPSQEWALLAGVGVLGAGGLYWAYQHPKEVRAAAKSLGVADNEVVRGALDYIYGGNPEDRAVIGQHLAENAAAEHIQEPVKAAPGASVRPPTRKLNEQETKVVAALQAAGHTAEAAQFSEIMAMKPEAGVLRLPGAPSQDPVELAGQVMGARAQYDEIRAEAVHRASMEGTKLGLQGAELQQHVAQADQKAAATYEGWARNPATLVNSMSMMNMERGQRFGDAEIQAARVEASKLQLRAGGEDSLSRRSADARVEATTDEGYQRANVVDAVTTAQLHPGSAWNKHFAELVDMVAPTADENARADRAIAAENAFRLQKKQPEMTAEEKATSKQSIVRGLATTRFVDQVATSNPEAFQRIHAAVDAVDQSITVATLLDPRTAAQAPLYKQVADELRAAGVTPENAAQKFQEHPELRQYVDHVSGAERWQAPYAGRTTPGGVAERNVAATQADARAARPSVSPLSATADILDPVLTGVDPHVLGMSNMVSSPMAYGADSRGVFNPYRGRFSMVRRDPDLAWQANRQAAVLERTKQEQELQDRGDFEGLQKLRATPLPTSSETKGNVENANLRADASDLAGRGAQAWGLSNALRVSAPVMGPLKALLFGGSFVGSSQAFHGKNPLAAGTPEERDNLQATLGGLTGFAAQTAAARTRVPELVAQAKASLAAKGPGGAFRQFMSKLNPEITGRVSRGLQGVSDAAGYATQTPEGLQAIRDRTSTALKAVTDRSPKPASSSWLNRFGRGAVNMVTNAPAKAGIIGRSVVDQARWARSLGTMAEAEGALSRLTMGALKSGPAAQLLRLNALRGGIALGAATVQYGVLGTGAQAAFDVGGHILNITQGKASERSDQEQYQRAYNAIIDADGRPEDAWGTGSVLGQARDVGAYARHAIGMNFRSIVNRQAGVTAYYRMKNQGASPGLWSGAGALITGVNDEDNGYWQQTGAVRGARDAMYATAEKRALQRGTEIGEQLVKSNPLWVGAPAAKQDAMINGIAASWAKESVGHLYSAPTIVQSDADDAAALMERRVKSWKPNVLALEDGTGAGLYGEAESFMKHILPEEGNGDLHASFHDLGVANAVLNSGGDFNGAVQAGNPDKNFEVAAGYAERNIAALENMPGGVGQLYKAHQQVYGGTRRRLERALRAPEYRHLPEKDKTAIMEAGLKHTSSLLKPEIDKLVASRAPLNDLMSPSPESGGKSRLDAFVEKNGLRVEQRLPEFNSGSAEQSLSAASKEFAGLLAPEDFKVLADPALVRQKVDAATGVDFETRNNNEATGSYTNSSSRGQALRERSAQYTKDLGTTGFNSTPDGFDRLIGDAARSGALPVRYVDVAPDRRSPEFISRRNTEVEMGPRGPEIIVRGTPNPNRPAYTPEMMSAVTEAIADRNPELLRGMAQGQQKADITPVLMARERPALEAALRAPQGGFNILGPDGKPAGTVGTWDELRMHIGNPANAQNYAKVWRPEVQKYLGDWKQYRASVEQRAPESTPEIDQQLDIRSAYQRFYDKERTGWERAQWEAKQPKPSQGARTPLGQVLDHVNPLKNRQVPSATDFFKPSMTDQEFSQAFNRDPSKYVSPEALQYHQRYQAWENQRKSLQAPAGPGPASKYVAPKPAAPTPAASPPVQPTPPPGQPAKP